jgi:hypothetical protein
MITDDWTTLNRNMAALQNRGHGLFFQPTAAVVHRKAGTWFDDPVIYGEPLRDASFSRRFAGLPAQLSASAHRPVSPGARENESSGASNSLRLHQGTE